MQTCINLCADSLFWRIRADLHTANCMDEFEGAFNIFFPILCCFITGITNVLDKDCDPLELLKRFSW